MKKIHRREVKILRSLGQNEENMCLSLDESCHCNGLNPKIDNQTISLISTVPKLVILYGGKLKGKLTKCRFLTRVL